MPMKRFVHESVTKAELGISKAKDDGYISGMEENLQNGNIKGEKFKTRANDDLQRSNGR